MVIVYAMIGIPIMLVCVAVVGEVMANVFRFVYIQLCCCGVCARRARLRRRQNEMAERRRRELEAAQANQRVPPTWTQLVQEQMSLTRGQQPMVVDDYDDLFDEEVPPQYISYLFSKLRRSKSVNFGRRDIFVCMKHF